MSPDENLWERANDPEELVFQYWGKLLIRPWECALVQGVGKVPYDPAIHDRSVLAVEVKLDPLPENQLTFSVEREEVHFSTEHKAFLQSVHNAGIDHIAKANGLFCRLRFEKSGSQYPEKDRQTGQPTGKMKDKTYIHVEEFFESEKACRENFYEIRGNAGQQPDPANTIDPTPAQNGQLETMKAFLDVVLNQAIEKEGESILYEQFLVWLDDPAFSALKPVYGASVPEARPFVEARIAELSG